MNEIFHKEISKQKHKKLEDLLKLQLKFELSLTKSNYRNVNSYLCPIGGRTVEFIYIFGIHRLHEKLRMYVNLLS